MHNALSRICLPLALLGASAATWASVDAFVFQNGPAFIVDNGTEVVGYASAELGGGGTDGAGSYSYVGSAYASTRRGALGSAVTVTGAGYEPVSNGLTVTAFSSFEEMVTVSADGPVTFRLAVQGSFAAVDGGSARARAKLEVATLSPARASASARGSLGFAPNEVVGGSGATVISALRSNYIVWLERTFIATAGIPFPVEAELELLGVPPPTGQTSALFNNTAQLAIFLPEGVSFTSESGQFLADVRTPVPEPATPWLWLTGVMLLLATARRRVIRLQPSTECATEVRA